ncbi:MAG: exo-alpha-sialidase [Thermotogae bacterium]|nr:exo-alpha-sialidase [Thermotogota bacterium]
MLNVLMVACGCLMEPVNLSDDPAQDRPYLDTWNHPTERSTKNIAVCNDKVHVAWFNSDTWSHSGYLYYRRSLNRGLTWEPKVTIAGYREFARELWIECSGDTVVIAYEVVSGGNVDILYRISEDGGATWSPEYSLVSSYTSYNQEAPALALIGARMHWVWADNRPVFFVPLYNTYYKRSDDLGATWTADRIQDLSDSPIIVADPSNPNIFHMWFMIYNTSQKRARYRRSTNAGVSWSSTVDMSGYNAGGPTPYDRPIGSIAAVNNVVYYTWVDERYGNKEVILKRSTDGGNSWSGPVNLSGTPTKSWNPFVAASPTGEARVYWMDSLDGDWEIVCKITTDWGNSWGTVQRLTNNTAHDGAVSVAYYDDHWFILWSSDVSGNYEVYFTRDPCPDAVGDGDLKVEEKTEVKANDVEISGNRILIRGEGNFKLFSSDGRLVASGTVAGEKILKPGRGVWFLIFRGKTYRAVLR